MGAESDLLEDFGAFYRAELDVVLAFCVVRVRNLELAADLAAEVFAAALIGRHGYRQARGSTRQWLLGIAANKVADARRRGSVERRAQQRLGIPAIEWTDGDLERIAALTDDERLIAMLGDLPAEQRDAVQARIVEERAYDEIARISGVSEVTIRKRVSRGLATLRERLSKETDDQRL